MADRARLRFIAGKGGVGRTAVARALAAKAAAGGARTLLIDAGPTAVGSKAADRGAAEEGASSDYSFLRLSAQDSVDEYLKRSLRLPVRPARLKPMAAIFNYVAIAAPGVREILTIGKIGEEVRSGGWDEVIVDAPASGHLVELLNAPDELLTLVGGAGPLAAESRWLGELLAEEMTSIWVVALPEPIVVAETIDLMNRLGDSDVAVEAVVINRMPPSVGAAGRVEVEQSRRSGDDSAVLARLAIDMDDWARPCAAALEAMDTDIDIYRLPWAIDVAAELEAVL